MTCTPEDFPAMHELAAHIDRSDAPRGETSAWKPLVLCLLIVTTFASFRSRDASALWGSGGIDAQVKFQLLSWLLLGCVALWLLATGRADLRLLRRGPLFWYCCFVALALLSTVYSASPKLTALRSMQLAVAVVLVISLREHLGSIYLFIVAYIGINWCLFLLAVLGLDGGLAWIRGPDDAYISFGGTADGPWRFGSAFGHPSQISVVAAVGAIGLSARTFGRRWATRGPLIAWLVLTVVLTVSRTAIAGLVVGLVVVAMGRRVLLPSLCFAGFAVSMLFMSYDRQEAAGRYLMRGQSAQEFQSLTGRVPVYETALRRVEESWPIGNGFRAARKELFDEGAPIVHAHNLFLEALTGMGLAGGVLVGMVVLTLAASAWTILRRPRPPSCPVAPAGWELCGILVSIFAFCVLDAGFAVGVNPFLMLFLVVAALTQTVLLDGNDVVEEVSCRT